MNVVQVVTFIVAFALAASRILNATKPFWSIFPAWLARVMPALVVAVPALGQLIAGAQTWTDVSVAFLTAGALFMPGSASHLSASNSGAKPPSFPPLAGVTLLMIALCLTGCGLFGTSSPLWPVAEHCAPSEATVLSQVEAILFSGGDDYEAKLTALAQQLGADGKLFVECAIQQFLGSPGANTVDASDAKARGKAFLVKVHQ